MKKTKGSKTKIALKLAKIKWLVKEVPINKVTPTEKNYKIKTELGEERLRMSLQLFGLAGTVVTNHPNNKGEFNLIDGNSRRVDAIEAGEKKLWVSYPNRKLTPKEFKEMSAMYDYAKAGEVDIDRIEKDLGTTSDFYKRWNREVPMELLDKMGAKGVKGIKVGKVSVEEGKQIAAQSTDIQMVQLFFSTKQEVEFRKIEEKLAKKFKTDNTTMTVLRAMRALK